jgi:hypothetical protein
MTDILVVEELHETRRRLAEQFAWHSESRLPVPGRQPLQVAAAHAR